VRSGCVQRIEIVFTGILLLGLVFFIPLGSVFGQPNDPLFRESHTPCPHPQPVNSLEITSAGINRHGCVQAGTISIVNRLPGQPVSLCLGHQGRCVHGHRTPFTGIDDRELGDRLSIGPGQTAKGVTFRSATRVGFFKDRTIPQNYPITIVPVRGMRSANLDLVVKGAAPLPPPSTPIH
jgi:hypothetical protein